MKRKILIISILTLVISCLLYTSTKFIEKDIKKACRRKVSFFINERSLNNIKSLTIWVTERCV